MEDGVMTSRRRVAYGNESLRSKPQRKDAGQCIRDAYRSALQEITNVHT